MIDDRESIEWTEMSIHAYAHTQRENLLIQKKKEWNIDYIFGNLEGSTGHSHEASKADTERQTFRVITDMKKFLKSWPHGSRDLKSNINEWNQQLGICVHSSCSYFWWTVIFLFSNCWILYLLEH